MKSLGIDLGSNSLGWAILEDGKINDQGVLIFDEGIIRAKGVDSLETPAAQRRRHRMERRLKFRRKLRKMHVLKILIENEMCPLSMDEWNELRKFGTVPKNQAFIEWLKSVPSTEIIHVNPYYARAMAAKEKINSFLLGRALYHLAQRRGFKSSRKDQMEEKGGEDKHQGGVKRGIAELTRELEKRNCTLGQYFYELNQTGEKIRNRYTGRVEHYQKEFEKIAEVQGFSDELKEALRKALFFQRPLRSQKHLVGKCQLEKTKNRCLAAHPLFELYRMHAFLNTIKLDEGNGMRSLTADERKRVEKVFFRKDRSFEFEKIIKALYPAYKGKKNEPLPVIFNYYKDRDIPSCRVAHQLNTVLEENFLTWKCSRNNAEKSSVLDYQAVFDALTFYDDNDLLKDFGVKTLGLREDQAESLTKIAIPEGYANYSLYAIRRILPFLEIGIELSTSVLLAKLPEIMGIQYSENKKKIISDILTIISDFRQESKLRDKDVNVIPLNIRLRSYLEDEWKLSPAQIDSLYWNVSTYSSLDDSGHQRTLLGKVELGMIKNPLVQRSLTILRRLVNDLRKNNKIDEFTQINIELARTVNDRNRRMAWETWQKQKTEERKAASAELRPLLGGVDPNEDLIDKYILWKEQNAMCLYSGRSIELSDLIAADSSFDIEHTIPRSRSGDNSMANKTLCDFDYNRNRKKGRFPTECDNYDSEIAGRLRSWIEKRDKLEALYQTQMKAAKRIDPSSSEQKASARQKALVTEFELRYWEKKIRYFEMTADNFDSSFLNRQLVDTGIMTRHAVEFLRSVYPKTYPVNGIAVSWARKCWGLQKQYEKKERIDHIHHVIDAVVIAALDRRRFQEICSIFRDNGDPEDHMKYTRKIAEIAPFANFSQTVYDAVENVLVKHLVRHNEFKQTWRNNLVLSRPYKTPDGTIVHKVHASGDTVRGQLHGDSFYGLIHSREHNTPQFVIRKFVNEIKTFKSIKDFEKIVDPGVRKIVITQISEYMASGMSFKEALASPLWMKKPDGNNPGIPVIKVRIFAENISEPHQLRRHLTPSVFEYKNFYYVNSAQGANFRLALFLKQKQSKGKIVEYWDMEIDNILTHAKNLKNEGYIPPEKRTDGRFLGYIYQGCAVLKYEKSPDELSNLAQNELQKRLYVLVKFKKDKRMTLCYHREARDNTALSQALVELGKSKTGESSLKFDIHQELLLVSQGNIKDHLLFEGIHFQLSMDGTITFL